MYSPTADKILLKRYAQTGDESAFFEVVTRYAGLVYSTCLRVLGDRTRAEDAAQETFVRLMGKANTINTSLAGWLHRAATQLSIDALRSDRARRKREAACAVTETACRSGKARTWAEVSPMVDEALMELPDEFRILLVSHFMEGRRQADLAAERNISAATLSRQVNRALEALRQGLGKKGMFIGLVLLAEFLAIDSSEAAPPALAAELGKLSMMSRSRGVFDRPVNQQVGQSCARETWARWVALALSAAILLGCLRMQLSSDLTIKPPPAAVDAR